MIFIVISLLIFIGFNLLIGRNYGIPTSLSKSYYSLREDKIGWMFSVVLLITSISLMVALLDITNGKWYQFLAFFAGVAPMFVALSPNYQELQYKNVHIVAAVISAIATALIAILMDYWWLLSGMLGAVGLLVWRLGRWIYWTEMGLFGSAYLIVFFRLMG